MPSQQRRRRHDEGSPTLAWQQSAGSGDEHPVDGGHRGTARFRPKDREFVPQHNDFEFLELVRPNDEGDELEKPAKQHVAERHGHETSIVTRLRPNSTHKP